MMKVNQSRKNQTQTQDSSKCTIAVKLTRGWLDSRDEEFDLGVVDEYGGKQEMARYLLRQFASNYRIVGLELFGDDGQKLLQETFNPFTGNETRTKTCQFQPDDVLDWEFTLLKDPSLEAPAGQPDRRKMRIIRSGCRGYGFAETLDGPHETAVFCHLQYATELGQLRTGQVITARIIDTPRGRQARDIRLAT